MRKPKERKPIILVHMPKKASAVFKREEVRFWGVLDFSPLVLRAQTSAACLRSSLNYFFFSRAAFPAAFIPNRPKACQPDLQIKSCAYNGCIICQIKMSAPSNFFLIIPYCFVYLLCLIYFFNNSSILECKHQVKAKARMLEKNNSASPKQMSPVSLLKYLLNIIWIHRKLQICWNCRCWVWGFFEIMKLSIHWKQLPIMRLALLWDGF